MPHYMLFSGGGHVSSDSDGQSHRASSHRQWKPGAFEDSDGEDHFDFDLSAMPEADDQDGPSPAENPIEDLMFAPLTPRPQALAEDHSASDEHEIEYDVSAGV